VLPQGVMRGMLWTGAAVLVLTWCVGWPLLRWVAQQHAQEVGMVPQLLPLSDLSGRNVPDVALLQVRPLQQQSVVFEQSHNGGLSNRTQYVAMNESGRVSDAVQVVWAGNRPWENGPPPYAARLERGLVPVYVRRALEAKGVRWAEPVVLATGEYLDHGRLVPNHPYDSSLREGLLFAGSVAGIMLLIGAWVLPWVRKLRSANP